MADHLCLKWNNHSASFMKYICKIQVDEKFCDATIVCQGKYFPVHRIVLSTCSDYFAEIFDRMQTPHPYIVFKDIEPREMDLLLTYMYKGEVNVTQDLLPSLIKAAEALKIKGLAVPDDVTSNTDSPSGKKRMSSNDQFSAKRKLEESKRRRRNSDSVRQGDANPIVESTKTTKSKFIYENDAPGHQVKNNELVRIKEEPVDSSEYGHTFDNEQDKYSISGYSNEPLEDVFQYTSTAETSGIKSEENFDNANSFEDQSMPSSWTSMAEEDNTKIPPSSETSVRHDVLQMNLSSEDDRSFELLSKTSKRNEISLVTHLNECPYCGHKTRKKHDIKVHIMQKHTGERPFPCKCCPMKFVRRIDLSRHTRIHTGEKPFKCLYCSELFRHNISLKIHLRHKCKAYSLI